MNGSGLSTEAAQPTTTPGPPDERERALNRGGATHYNSGTRRMNGSGLSTEAILSFRETKTDLAALAS
jgi:hypothetical protein